MSEAAGQSIRRNVSVIAASRIITTSSSIMLMLVVPRTLGDVEYGRYYLAQSLLMLFMLVVDFGVGGSLPKAVARNRADAGQIVADALGVRLLMAGGAYGGLIAFAVVAGYPPETLWVIAIIGLSIFVNAVASIFNGLFQGFELMQVPSFAGIIGTVFIAVVGIGSLYLGGRTIAFSTAVLVGTAIIPGVLIFRMSRVVASIPRPQFGNVAGMLRNDLPYFLNTVFGMVYYRIDTVMLSLMTTVATVGWYGAAYRFFDSLMFIPYLLTVALFPVMSRLWGTDNERFLYTLRRTIVLVLIAGVPIALATAFYAYPIVELFYGTKVYGPSVVLLQIFSVCMLLVYIDSIVGSALMSADRQRPLSMISLSAVFVNVFLNLIAIPFTVELWGNGGIGAAAATGLTELFVMVKMFRLLPKGVAMGSVFPRIGRVALAGLLSAAIMAGMQLATTPWFIGAAVAMAGYGLLLIALRILQPEDYEIAASIPVVGRWVTRAIPERYRVAKQTV